MTVCGLSVCVRVCDYAVKPFCAASYFLGAAPSKPPVKQHSDTNHSANDGQGSAATFRSSAEVSRFVSVSAAQRRKHDRHRESTRKSEGKTFSLTLDSGRIRLTIRDSTTILKETGLMFVDSQRSDSGRRMADLTLFSIPTGYPKN